MTDNLTAFGEALAAFFGGASAAVSVYPIDLVKTRVQVQAGQPGEGKYKGIIHAMYSIAREEGLLGLYSGVSSDIMRASVSGYVYFFCYNVFKRLYFTIQANAVHKRAQLAADEGKSRVDQEKAEKKIPFWTNIGLGIVAGCCTCLFMDPIDVARTRMQTRPNSAPDASSGPLTTMWHIVKTSGFSALYKGILASWVLTTNPAIQNLVFDRLKLWTRGYILAQKIHKDPACTETIEDQELTPAQSFIIGAIAKTIATVITYPYIFAKVKLQHQADRRSRVEGEKVYASAPDVILTTVRTIGFLALYSGLRAQIAKSVIGTAFMFLYKEKAQQTLASIPFFQRQKLH